MTEEERPAEQPDQHEDFDAAFLAAQRRIQNPTKSATATVSGTTAGGKSYQYDYQYATLDDTMKSALDALNAEGIALRQPTVTMDDGRIGMKTILVGHGSEVDFGTLAIHVPDDPQKVGKTLTYFRRYALGSIGLVAESDTDGANATPDAGQSTTASGNDASEPQKKMIWAIASKELAYDKDTLESTCVEVTGASLSKLTKRQASQLIDELQKRVKTEPPPEDSDHLVPPPDDDSGTGLTPDEYAGE